MLAGGILETGARRADDVTRILAICGAWGVSTIGELPDAPRAVVMELGRVLIKQLAA